MKELKLKDNNPDKYVIVKLPDGTMFIHDKESDENFFSQKSIEELCGLSQRMVSYHLSQYGRNIQNMYITLNVFNSFKPVKFYSFDSLTYVAFRSNEPKAVETRNYINKQLNRMFNQDIGFTKSIEPSHEDKILSRAKKQQAKIRMRSDALYTELNFMNPSSERTKEILKEINELKPEELRIKRQIKNIENCFGSLSRDTSARSQSKLLDFDNNSKKKLL